MLKEMKAYGYLKPGREGTMRLKVFVKYLIFLTSILIILTTPAFAEVFTWTDDKGTTNFTDDSTKIPAKYRNKAVSLGGSYADIHAAQPLSSAPSPGISRIAPIPDVRK